MTHMPQHIEMYQVVSDVGDSEGAFIVGIFDNESAAEVFAEEYQKENEGGEFSIIEITVPLPEIIINISGGSVASVTLASGLPYTEGVVRDYDVEGMDLPTETDADGNSYVEFTL